jgi:hypothetical protein
MYVFDGLDIGLHSSRIGTLTFTAASAAFSRGESYLDVPLLSIPAADPRKQQ